MQNPTEPVFAASQEQRGEVQQRTVTMVRGPDPTTHEERLRMLALFSLVHGRLEG